MRLRSQISLHSVKFEFLQCKHMEEGSGSLPMSISSQPVSQPFGRPIRLEQNLIMSPTVLGHVSRHRGD